MRMTDAAWAMLLLLGAIWGASFVAVAAALREMGPMSTVLWRTGLGAGALWLWVLWRGVPVPRSGAFLAGCAGMGLLNNAIPFALIAWGQQSVESGLAAILNAATAPFGALAAALLADERLTPARAGGIALGVVGVASIVGPAALGGLDPRSLGQLAIVGATLSYALASVWGRVRLSGAAPEAAAAGMCTGGFLFAWPAALALEGWPGAPSSGVGWSAVLAFGLFGTALAYILYWRILGLAGAANTMLVTLVIPPFALILGWALLGEAVAPRALAGLGIIALGLAVLDGRPLAALGARFGRLAGRAPRA